jgi:hypothetical protein
VSRSLFAAAVSAAMAALAGCTTKLDVGRDMPPTIAVAPDSLADPPLLLAQGDDAGATFTVVGSAAPGEPLDIRIKDSPKVPGVTYVRSCEPGQPGVCRFTLFAADYAAPGEYTWTASVSNGTTNSKQATFVVAPRVQVTSTPDTQSGAGGRLDEPVSTALQPADWQEGLFSDVPNVTATLQTLAPAKVLIQLGDYGAIPLLHYDPNPANRTTADWDFTKLDAIVEGVLGAGLEPVLQIASIPKPTTPTGVAVDSIALLSDYAAALVAYYDNGGFTWGPGAPVTRTSGTLPITWWAILADFNEPPLSWTGDVYAKAYSQVVPAMVAATPTPIHFSAFEYSDVPDMTAASTDLPLFLGAVTAGAPFDAVSLHFFGASGPHAQDTRDVDVFTTTQNFVDQDFRAVRARVDPAVPVWVTESNVQSAVPNNQGYFSLQPNTPFTNDTRGTSTFFAAWKPYLFSKLGKAGGQGLFQWEFTAGNCRPPDTSHCATAVDGGLLGSLDTQSGEISFADGTTYVSYWVDYWLGQLFAGAPRILTITQTDGDVDLTKGGDAGTALGEIEALATRSDADGSVVVMIVNHTVAPADPDGGTQERTVAVDLPTDLGLTKAQKIVIDSTVNLGAYGALGEAVPFAPRMVVHFDGYGVAFLRLTVN